MVRTSVLSRRWVDLWRTAPCVNADMAEFGITSLSFHRNLEQRWSKFEAFTTSLLLLRSAAASLDKFRLCAPGRFPQDVDRWVRHAIECCLRVLEVHIWIPPAVVFPSPLLGANSHRLKRLQLCVVCLDGQFAELIRSGCPVLEKLELHGCTQTFHEISSRTLKSLVVVTCGDLAGDAVFVTAPHLEYLQMDISYGSYSNGVSLCVTASLVEAMICLPCYQDEEFPVKHQRRLLVDLCNVQNLDLVGFETKAVLNEESHKLPIFPDMRALSLADCFLDEYDLSDKLETLGSFLQNAPCLEKLTLNCCMFEVDSEMEGQIVRKSVTLAHQGGITIQSSKLKFVKVIYQANHDNHLIELVWGIGRMLPNARITLTNSSMD